MARRHLVTQTSCGHGAQWSVRTDTCRWYWYRLDLCSGTHKVPATKDLRPGSHSLLPDGTRLISRDDGPNTPSLSGDIQGKHLLAREHRQNSGSGRFCNPFWNALTWPLIQRRQMGEAPALERFKRLQRAKTRDGLISGFYWGTIYKIILVFSLLLNTKYTNY